MGTVMLSVITHFLSSKINPSSLRETYFEVLYFEIYNDINLEEANTQREISSHSVEDNMVLSIKTVSQQFYY